MLLELHVWGPAFSLPSIDAQCLATMTYFSLVLPKDAWVLVASSDPSVSPTNELPALRSGATWVSRFRNIVDYLRQYSGGEWDLDRDLTGGERADNIAFSSFVESRGQSLVDLSLYVSSQNYWDKTSPAYGAILQWPNQWILPPKIHAQAKLRTEHLGLSSLDLEAIREQKDREHSAAVAAGKIPKTLIRNPRETVSTLLSKTSQQNQFRLEALTAEFFEPLESLLGHQPYFLSPDRPTTLDCLALAYLSLADIPDLPFSWLRDAMRSKAPGLTAYTDRMRRHHLGLEVKVIDALSATSTSSTSSPSLPWQAPERASFATLGKTLYDTLADSTPILKHIRLNNRLREAALAPHSGLSGKESKAVSAYALARKHDLYLSIGSVVVSLAALVGYMAHIGLVGFSLAEQEVPSGTDPDPDADIDAVVDAGQVGDFLSML
ncbi:hypothetical protein ASPZODRAFT_131883 [Penicilliopsis zonata CBS 506.65]|uniref:Mitochondrial outer membrane transport complex Sam37/metaxin N-terminal domain-containing protein n=1 Tax=Penicilliopsis zonata CBS 506.65 TaxID=1073090 RepID=A0A1L9SIC2_9EURO|nr:hypothetical protein ASPZODRAFT_131883 [Penicilliopsis zonata CBS 506.65]OJJ46965.1 hypothetical protein ASPZODRAFT_131883 [Penicilliopsis zonata CBS 506.65]